MFITLRKHSLAASVAVFLLFIASCGENSVLKPKPTESKPDFNPAAYLAKDTIGFFRGAEFGDEIETIKQMENDSFIVFDSPNLLQYEYKLPGERRYKLEYKFKRNKLTTFSFDLFIVDASEAAEITEDLRNWFNKKYKDEVQENGVFVWPLKSEGYQESYIELTDESAEFGYGKVNISAYAIR